MGTSTSVAQFSGKFRSAAEATGQAASRRRATEAAALVAKDVYNDQASKAGLRPGATLAGKEWPGYDYRMRDDNSAIVVPRGPVWLHNSPARAYWILPRGERTNVFGAGPVLPGMARPVVAQAGRKRRRGGAEALQFKGRYAASAFRKSRRGKRWASKAVALIEQKSPEQYQKSMSTVWSAVFK